MSDVTDPGMDSLRSGYWHRLYGSRRCFFMCDDVLLAKELKGEGLADYMAVKEVFGKVSQNLLST